MRPMIPTGLEPDITTLKGLCPNLLDHGTKMRVMRLELTYLNDAGLKVRCHTNLATPPK